ncbi:glycoside hydrolase family 13 protein [Zasmidium cellare ATCC 36951]|uniref:Alpha-amylase n=1 Tax=Zasmidium cellare ATCC 36951 TaxID=1080233 RepID=A0A6A6CQX9_ZASCE|nr:glycoside hydrolase family 13 protein [Zasmidium cellare ATCC 36951]KAF2168578.1 glycoside hydrolase family 13 protein [Zasmidium cellare ATCC 36951]
MKYTTLSTLASFSGLASALTPAQWRTQSIYQVMTDRFARTDGSTSASCDVNNYCGGTYQGLINKLAYIQNMGFTAIWISPIVENIPQSTADGSAYHGYWAQNIYNVNTNFGAASDLVALSNALHNRGMYLMVDIVTNHFAQANTRANFNASAVGAPFNNVSMYHTPCDIDYNNQTSIEQCWQGDNIVALADVRTEDSNVQALWNSWIPQLVSNYTIDGLRIDSAKHVTPSSLSALQSAANGMHVLGEVYSGDPSYLCPYQSTITGLMNYPAYFWITQAFKSTSGNMTTLATGINTLKSTCKDVTLLGSFLENHDNPRFPALTSDQSLIRNAVSFALLQDGIPILYQGQEQKLYGGSVPYNREALWSTAYSTSSSATLYPFITTLNKIRAWAIKKDAAYITYNAWPIYTDTSTIIMRKGNANAQVVSVFTNRGASAKTATLTLGATNSGFVKYQSVMDVVACKSFTTDSKGNLGVTITSGLPQVFYPTSALKRSGICNQ